MSVRLIAPIQRDSGLSAIVEGQDLPDWAETEADGRPALAEAKLEHGRIVLQPKEWPSLASI